MRGGSRKVLCSIGWQIALNLFVGKENQASKWDRNLIQIWPKESTVTLANLKNTNYLVQKCDPWRMFMVATSSHPLPTILICYKKTLQLWDHPVSCRRSRGGFSQNEKAWEVTAFNDEVWTNLNLTEERIEHLLLEIWAKVKDLLRLSHL